MASAARAQGGSHTAGREAFWPKATGLGKQHARGKDEHRAAKAPVAQALALKLPTVPLFHPHTG